MRIEDYLRLVTGQIRCKKACPCVEKELEDHIMDQMEVYVKDGMDEEEALDKAILEMGDPVEVGVEFDRIHRPQMSWGMVLAVGILGILSVVLQYRLKVAGNEMGLPHKQLVFTVVGFLLMLGVYYLDYSILGKYGKQIGAVFLGFMILTIPFRVMVNDASTFIYLGGFTISVPLAMYLYVPVFGGILYAYRKGGYGVLWKIALWAILPVLLVFRVPSLFHACFLVLTLMVMFTAAVRKGWYQVSEKKVLSVLWTGAVLMPVLVLLGGNALTAYQQDRLEVFLRGSSTMDYISKSISEIFKRSVLFGESKAGLAILNNQIPGIYSEYVFVSLVACFGIVAGVLVVGVYFGMIWKTLHISKEQHNQLGAVVDYGCSMVFAVQIIYNFLQCLQVAPASSVALPFLANSGSGTLVFYILMGIILSVYRYKNIPLNADAKKLPKVRVTVE